MFKCFCILCCIFSDINECDPNPCQNDGTCEDGVASFTCQCVPGYAGDTCDTGKVQKRENGTKINVLILLVPLIHYDK